jgi:hypothetical protein
MAAQTALPPAETSPEAVMTLADAANSAPDSETIGIALPVDATTGAGLKRRMPGKPGGPPRKVLKAASKPGADQGKGASEKAERRPKSASKSEAKSDAMSSEPQEEAGEKLPDEEVRTASEMSFVVVKTVKNFLRNAAPEPIHMGGDFIAALNAKVAEDIMQAIQRVLGNGRKTIRGIDL